MRKMTPADERLYLTLAKEFYHTPGAPHPVPEQYFRNTFAEILLSDVYLEGFILDYKGEAAGYALITKYFSQERGGLAYLIDELYVRPAYQGKGIGQQFFQEYEESVRGKTNRLRLEVMPENTRAEALYRRMGYQDLCYKQLVKDFDD